MQVTYLILAHKNPEQLRRLIDALQHPDTRFYIHIDKKVDSTDFHESLRGIVTRNVSFIKDRIRVGWGEYSVVQAVLNSMVAILKDLSPGDSGYVMLLSGQDYPIATNETILGFLDKKNGTEFMGYAKMPTPFWTPDGGMYRVERYHFPGIWMRAYFEWVASVALPKRRFVKGFSPYGGSTWWGLTYECIRYIVAFVQTNRAFVNFYKRTALPDESFFHTIVMNSPFAGNVEGRISGGEICDPLRFVRWSRRDGSHPEVLTSKDFDTLVMANRLFARKFDATVDSDILDLIDAWRGDML